MIDDVLVKLMVALEEHGVTARGQDAEGYGITLRLLSEMQDAGWRFEPPDAEPGAEETPLERVLDAIRRPGSYVPSQSKPPSYAEPLSRWQARAVISVLA